MNIIRSIDLWTEKDDNHIECFNGAFVDGFESGIPFDTFKIIRNSNCVIYSNLNIRNKHNAIVFYRNNIPVRLMVINGLTDIDKCINIALNQELNGIKLGEIYNRLQIQRLDIDLHQQPIINNVNKENEIDVGSCDRPGLLDSMLSGSYTESDTDYGKSNNDSDYSFIPNTFILYNLATDTEQFIIEHHCAFINSDMTRIIPLQDNSQLDIEEIENYYKGRGL